jgi:ATP-binding cassette, subfamily F, member 3
MVFGDQMVLRDVNWDVKTGDRVGCVGSNGAGKSLMLKVSE